jgi:ABC-type transport system substrate-binding protein
MQMLLDLTTAEKDSLAGLNRVDVFTPTEPKEAVAPYLANPRVYLLLPNFRQRAMQNLDVRRAVSAALDREKILNDQFRGKDKKQHRAIMGPYPLESWAYNPSPTFALEKTNPYKVEQAKAFVNNAKKAVGGNIPPLTLLYSTSDPSAAKACPQIKTMLEAVGLQVRLDAKPFQDLMAEMTKERPAFDLVYWPYDFESETLALWPLFDPAGLGPNGRNYLGLRGDSQIEGKFREILQRRDFNYVQTQTHILHDLLVEGRMAVIPLWQLDRHVAVHRSLRFTRLHPLSILDEVELWQLRSGG